MGLILASSSPRRSEILANAGYQFTVVPSDAPEDLSCEEPAGLVLALALRKAGAVAREHPRDVVAGADTVVSLEGRVFGKPADTQDAVRMLRELSGRAHEVYTGVALLGPGWSESFVCRTRVYFRRLSEELIARYAATGEPLDKAGAYGIQGRGSVLVEKIEGDYFNVMGLPVSELAARLRESFGIEPF